MCEEKIQLSKYQGEKTKNGGGGNNKEYQETSEEACK